jgi:hypothetical protein
MARRGTWGGTGGNRGGSRLRKGLPVPSFGVVQEEPAVSPGGFVVALPPRVEEAPLREPLQYLPAIVDELPRNWRAFAARHGEKVRTFVNAYRSPPLDPIDEIIAWSNARDDGRWRTAVAAFVDATNALDAARGVISDKQWDWIHKDYIQPVLDGHVHHGLLRYEPGWIMRHALAATDNLNMLLSYAQPVPEVTPPPPAPAPAPAKPHPDAVEADVDDKPVWAIPIRDGNAPPGKRIYLPQFNDVLVIPRDYKSGYALDNWLLQRAHAYAKQTRNEHMRLLLPATAKRMTNSDRAAMNTYLFDGAFVLEPR